LRVPFKAGEDGLFPVRRDRFADHAEALAPGFHALRNGIVDLL
jgi:hypothetical protein